MQPSLAVSMPRRIDVSGADVLLSGIECYRNEPMSKHTTFRIGGPAEYFVCPKTPDELKRVFEYEGEKIVVGNGSNLLFPDSAFPGMVIKYSDCSIYRDGNSIVCGSGILMSKIASFAYDNALAGFEFASGIPGSIGGGVRMNAGAYGFSLDSVLESVEFLDTKSGAIKSLPAEKLELSYRHSVFCDNPGFVITKVVLKLNEGNKEEIRALIDDFTLRRKTKQPLKYPSAGSVFKRPEGYFAGALIEDAGLKGCTVGGAQVSELHAGFIINTGNATAADVTELIAHIKKVVLEKSGVELECEICIL